MSNSIDTIFDNSERYRDLGCAIAYYRKRKKLTQEQVADRVGISRQHMGPLKRPIWFGQSRLRLFSILLRFWRLSRIYCSNSTRISSLLAANLGKNGSNCALFFDTSAGSFGFLAYLQMYPHQYGLRHRTHIAISMKLLFA